MQHACKDLKGIWHVMVKSFEVCKKSPHFETQKCTIWHLLKPVSNVQEFTPLGNRKKWHVTLLLFLWHVNGSIKGSTNPSSFWQVCVQKNRMELNWILNCIFSTSFLHAAVKMRIGDNCIWWVWLCVPGPWLMPDPIWVSFLTYSGLPPLTICSISGWYLYQYKNCF